MVQFKQSPWFLPYSKVPAWDEYWKLVDYIPTCREIRDRLRAARFHFKSAAKEPRLKKLLVRSQQGLLSYDACKIDELRQFCRQRTLEFRGKARDDMISSLENADDAATFELLKLPPELRNRIYSLYFQSLDTLAHPTIPPLVKVSRQLRQETLLLFYQSCTIYIIIPKIHPQLRDMGTLITEDLPEGAKSKAATTIFSCMPEDYLGSISKIHLLGPISMSRDWWLYGEWLIDLGSGANEIHISAGKKRYNAARWYYGELTPAYQESSREKCQELEALLKSELKAIRDREGKNKLQRGDFDVLKRLFESTYHQR